jgi:hypothetical protein
VRKKEDMRYGYQRKMNEIFIALEASHDYSNRHYFDSRASAQVHHFDNRASCAGYSDGQANCTIF